MGRPQEFFGAGMWSENATSTHHAPVFVLEERHADGTRWIELHRYPTKDEDWRGVGGGGRGRPRSRSVPRPTGFDVT